MEYLFSQHHRNLLVAYQLTKIHECLTLERQIGSVLTFTQLIPVIRNTQLRPIQNVSEFELQETVTLAAETTWTMAHLYFHQNRDDSTQKITLTNSAVRHHAYHF